MPNILAIKLFETKTILEYTHTFGDGDAKIFGLESPHRDAKIFGQAKQVLSVHTLKWIRTSSFFYKITFGENYSITFAEQRRHQ